MPYVGGTTEEEEGVTGLGEGAHSNQPQRPLDLRASTAFYYCCCNRRRGGAWPYPTLAGFCL